jgi:hypothetical protein
METHALFKRLDEICHFLERSEHALVLIRLGFELDELRNIPFKS